MTEAGSQKPGGPAAAGPGKGTCDIRGAPVIRKSANASKQSPQPEMRGATLPANDPPAHAPRPLEIGDPTMGMTRRRLPDRRPADTVTLVHEGAKVDAGVGFDPDTEDVLEVFLRQVGPQGSDMDRLLDDIGFLVSRLLQRGEAPAELARGIGRLGGYPNVGDQGSGTRDRKPPPASIVGVVADWLADLAAEAGPRRAAWAAWAAEGGDQGSGIRDQRSGIGHQGPEITNASTGGTPVDDRDDFKPGGTD